MPTQHPLVILFIISHAKIIRPQIKCIVPDHIILVVLGKQYKKSSIDVIKILAPMNYFLERQWMRNVAANYWKPECKGWEQFWVNWCNVCCDKDYLSYAKTLTAMRHLVWLRACKRHAGLWSHTRCAAYICVFA